MHQHTSSLLIHAATLAAGGWVCCSNAGVKTIQATILAAGDWVCGRRQCLLQTASLAAGGEPCCRRRVLLQAEGKTLTRWPSTQFKDVVYTLEDKPSPASRVRPTIINCSSPSGTEPLQSAVGHRAAIRLEEEDELLPLTTPGIVVRGATWALNVRDKPLTIIEVQAAACFLSRNSTG